MHRRLSDISHGLQKVGRSLLGIAERIGKTSIVDGIGWRSSRGCEVSSPLFGNRRVVLSNVIELFPVDGDHTGCRIGMSIDDDDDRKTDFNVRPASTPKFSTVFPMRHLDSFGSSLNSKAYTI